MFETSLKHITVPQNCSNITNTFTKSQIQYTLKTIFPVLRATYFAENKTINLGIGISDVKANSMKRNYLVERNCVSGLNFQYSYDPGKKMY